MEKFFTKVLRLGLLFKCSIFTFMQGSLACLLYRHIIWSHPTEPCIRPIRNILHRVLTYPHASTCIHTHPQKTRTYSSCRSSKMTWPDYVSSGWRIRLSPEFSCRLPPSIPGLTQWPPVFLLLRLPDPWALSNLGPCRPTYRIVRGSSFDSSSTPSNDDCWVDHQAHIGKAANCTRCGGSVAWNLVSVPWGSAPMMDGVVPDAPWSCIHDRTNVAEDTSRSSVGGG